MYSQILFSFFPLMLTRIYIHGHIGVKMNLRHSVVIRQTFLLASLIQCNFVDWTPRARKYLSEARPPFDHVIKTTYILVYLWVSVKMLMAVQYPRHWLKGQPSQPFNDIFKISTFKYIYKGHNLIKIGSAHIPKCYRYKPSHAHGRWLSGSGDEFRKILSSYMVLVMWLGPHKQTMISLWNRI